MELLRQFDSYRIRHVYRVTNKLADRLANRAIDQALQRQAKVDQAIAPHNPMLRGGESPDSTGQGGR